jgi:hypothetical protein
MAHRNLDRALSARDRAGLCGLKLLFLATTAFRPVLGRYGIMQWRLSAYIAFGLTFRARPTLQLNAPEPKNRRRHIWIPAKNRILYHRISYGVALFGFMLHSFERNTRCAWRQSQSPFVSATPLRSSRTDATDLPQNVIVRFFPFSFFPSN